MSDDLREVDQVCDLKLCESKLLHLHPGWLYRFTVDPDCEGCRRAAREAEGAEEEPALNGKEVMRPMKWKRLRKYWKWRAPSVGRWLKRKRERTKAKFAPNGLRAVGQVRTEHGGSRP